jgi:hypothetical protein
MMNGPEMQSGPEHLADLLLGPLAADDRERMQVMALRIFGRPAADDDLATWTDFLERYQAAVPISESPQSRRRLAWQGLCRALLSSNEFVYVE